MRIGEIWRYPVKSMAGERLADTELTAAGIPGDRVLYVLDGRGEIVSARTAPGLLGHHARFHDDDVTVDGLPWRDRRVADAVTAAVGPGARLVPATGPERFDILPLLVVSDGAVRAFGHDRRRLRPNLVISGVEGLAEREWEWRCLAAPAASIALAELRGRCIMTTWDPDTLTQDVDVLRGLRSRFGGRFALNAWTAREGPIAVGDSVELQDLPAEVPVPALGRFA